MLLVGLAIAVVAVYGLLVWYLAPRPPAELLFPASTVWLHHGEADEPPPRPPLEPMAEALGIHSFEADSLLYAFLPPDAHVYSSLHYYGGTTWHHLRVASSAPAMARLVGELRRQLEGWKARQYSYEGTAIYTFTRGDQRLALAHVDGYLLWGSGGQILEEALRARTDSSARAAVPLLPEGRSYINWRRWRRLLKGLASAYESLTPSNLRDGVYRIQRTKTHWEAFGMVRTSPTLPPKPVFRLPDQTLPAEVGLLVLNPPLSCGLIPRPLDSLLRTHSPMVAVWPPDAPFHQGVALYPDADSAALFEEWTTDSAPAVTPLGGGMHRWHRNADSAVLMWQGPHLIAANTPAALEMFLQKRRWSGPLANHPAYLAWEARLPDSFHHAALFIPTAYSSAAPLGPRPPFHSIDFLASLQQLGALGTYQIRASDSTAFHAWMTFQAPPPLHAAASLAWEVPLDSVITGPLSRVRNFRTGRHEVLAPDASGMLSAVSASGRIRWKYRLPSPVVAPAIEVDYYRNRKIQFLVLTRRHVLLLDRMGRNVAQYPIPLPEAARPGWRYFPRRSAFGKAAFAVPTSSGIRAFYLTGKPIPRWAPLRLGAPPQGPIRYFSFRGIRRLFVSDTTGRFYFIDPRGRISYRHRFSAPPVTPWFLQLSGSVAASYVYAFDSAGRLLRLSLGRQASIRPLFTPKGPIYATDADLLPAAGRERLVVNGPELLAFDRQWNLQWTAPLDTTAQAPPQVFSFQRRKIIGVWLQSGAMAFFSSEGRPLPLTLTSSVLPVGLADGTRRYLLVTATDHRLQAHNITTLFARP